MTGNRKIMGKEENDLHLKNMYSVKANANKNLAQINDKHKKQTNKSINSRFWTQQK